MKEIDFTQAKFAGKGFQFPGEFEITVLGQASEEFPAHVVALLESAGLTVHGDSLRQRASREGRFLSVTVSFHCDLREQYNAAHAVLRADAQVRHTL